MTVRDELRCIPPGPVHQMTEGRTVPVRKMAEHMIAMSDNSVSVRRWIGARSVRGGLVPSRLPDSPNEGTEVLFNRCADGVRPPEDEDASG